ncbi:MAG: hypothetical protein ABIU05_03920 [Nitrospirales bacterium]
MTNRIQSTDVNLTAFDILEALTGELPCYASPNRKVSDRKEDWPNNSPSTVEDHAAKTFG